MKEFKTEGKVLLRTSYGDVMVELFSKEAPKACRNFVALCQEKYFDECNFHRVEKNKYVETGNPFLKYGFSSGISIYDGIETIQKIVDRSLNKKPRESKTTIKKKGFPIETHSRLKFVTRGLVGMKSQETKAGKRNFSSFFITLNPCKELDFRHTLFGRITDNTIFNIMEMNDIELKANNIDGNIDVPLYPPKINSTEVLENPFGDLYIDINRSKLFSNLKTKKEKKKVGIKKNRSLLSFKKKKKKKKKKISYSGIVDKKMIQNSKQISTFKKRKREIKKKEQEQKEDTIIEKNPIITPLEDKNRKDKPFFDIKRIELEKKNDTEIVKNQQPTINLMKRKRKTTSNKKKNAKKRKLELGKSFLSNQKRKFEKKKKKEIKEEFSLMNLLSEKDKNTKGIQ